MHITENAISWTFKWKQYNLSCSTIYWRHRWLAKQCKTVYRSAWFKTKNWIGFVQAVLSAPSSQVWDVERLIRDRNPGAVFTSTTRIPTTWQTLRTITHNPQLQEGAVGSASVEEASLVRRWAGRGLILYHSKWWHLRTCGNLVGEFKKATFQTNFFQFRTPPTPRVCRLRQTRGVGGGKI